MGKRRKKRRSKIGGSEAKECLQQCLHNPSEVIRQAAEPALYEIEADENPFTFRFDL